MLNSDFRDILSAFSEEKVEFMLVGAYAVAAHGLPRATGDIDGQLVTKEEYSELRADVPLDARLFDPQYFATVHWKE